MPLHRRPSSTPTAPPSPGDATRENASGSLPPYTVRISARARRAQLRVLAHGTIEAVVPPGFDRALLEEFIVRHRDWLARRVARVELKRQRHPHLFEFPPSRIRLAALGHDWHIDYEWDSQSQPAARARDNGTLKVQASGPDHACTVLQRWLSAEAKRHLVPWLRRTSTELGLPINRVSVRAQKSRWGSCSSRHDISLNRNLLFLPPEGVRYLFIHELCHTTHMNHSRRFWSLVARLDPDYRQHEALLRHAHDYVPLWALPV